MLTLKNLLCAALAASLLLPAAEAEARFGKRSTSSDSDKEKKEKKEKKNDDDDDEDEKQEKRSSGRAHDASAVGSDSGRVHDASPVDSSPPPPPDRHPDTVIIVEQPPPPGYYVAPAPAYVAPPPPEPYVPRKDSVHYNMRLALGGGPLGGGAGVDLMLAFEGEQMGVDGRILGLSLPTDDGTEGSDGLTVAGAHITYALVGTDRLRLRLEGGVTTARAPDISFVGPSLASSFDARLLPSIDFESRVQVTPFPYRQLDAQGGLAYKPYPWAIRAGWRALMLDDAGRVDGVVHRDFFNGPFISFGLFL